MPQQEIQHYDSDGNRVTLKEYFESRLCAIEKAIIVAKEAIDARLESMNEFREQLSKQANTFLTRELYDTFHNFIQKEIAELQKEINSLQISKAIIENKASTKSVYITWVLATVSILLSLITLLFK